MDPCIQIFCRFSCRFSSEQRSLVLAVWAYGRTLWEHLYQILSDSRLPRTETQLLSAKVLLVDAI